ncbi:hypothetical protein [Enterococcus termitis]|uniref:Pectate lyase superfamily protein domain-containing protein n=1 Tax=Enterococcus termitis TaxID=332950 RepID=A0A1E5GTX1_9ENTE|nr:hypothetical protein [Enterococcus termitis]OEG15770.1 hypothetical protein BCR25_18660 [Enterococcus termitis]
MIKQYQTELNDQKKDFKENSDTQKENWEHFVDLNKEILEGVDPGGKLTAELIEARKPTEKPAFPTIGDRLNTELGNLAEFRFEESIIDKMKNEFSERAVSPLWFGAVGDGITDDGAAIKATHAFANSIGAPVFYPNKEYLLSDVYDIEIKTDVDWNLSTLIIDDKKYPEKPVFKMVSGKKISIDPALFEKYLPLKPDLMMNIPELSGHGEILVRFTDEVNKISKRYGTNADDGKPRMDFVKFDDTGDMKNQLAHEYSRLDSVLIEEMPSHYLTLKSGKFISTGDLQRPNYYARGIAIERSKVKITNISQSMIKNTKETAPCAGFLSISNCADVIIENCSISPRKADTVGSYGLKAENTVNLLISGFIGTDYTSDKNAKSEYWGVMSGFNMKDTVIENSEMNRVDSHTYSHNITVRGSKIFGAGMTLSGGGKLSITDSEFYCNDIISLRKDYGSSWNGFLYINNVRHYPKNMYGLIQASPVPTHDFGYECHLFAKIHVENYYIYHSDSVYALHRMLKINDFSKETSTEKYVNGGYHLANEIYLKNVKVVNKVELEGIVLFSTTNFLEMKSKVNGLFKEVNGQLKIVGNIRITLEDVDLYDFGRYKGAKAGILECSITGEKSNLPGYTGYTEAFLSNPSSLFFDISVSNCKNLSIAIGAHPANCNIDHCDILKFYSSSGGSRTVASISDTFFNASIHSDSASNMLYRTSSQSILIACFLSVPKKNDKTIEGEIIGTYEFLKKNIANSIANTSICLQGVILDNAIDKRSIEMPEFGLFYGNWHSQSTLYRVVGTGIQRPATPPNGFVYRNTEDSTIKTFFEGKWYPIQG